MAQWKKNDVTETEVIEIEQAARGGYARVIDSASPFFGEYVFASTPDMALRMLVDKLAAQPVSK